MGESTLRVLAVQSTPRVSSEVNVFLTLLDAAARAAPETPRLEVLLLQGVDKRGSGGREAAAAFARVNDVQVHEMSVGGLGREGVGALRRAAKVVDVTRVRLARPGLLRAARDFAPDVVYSAQQRWDQRLAVPLAAELDRPRVVHLHYIVGPWLGADAVASLQTANLVIGVSDFICSDAVVAGVAPERVQTLHNAAPDAAPLAPAERARLRARLRTDLGASPDARVVGMVGRLSESKCQLEVLQAMVPMLRRSNDVHLVFAGTEYPTGNGLSERLRIAAAEAGVGPQLHLLGFRNDVGDLLEAFDVFAHPSRDEPFGLALLEAMAHGLAVVAWREGGPKEIIVDGESGWLVPPMDLAGLTDALAALVQDESRRSAMGAAARRRVATAFRPEGAAARFAALLAGVVARA